MKILRLNLFQESACYKKPFSFKVAETYPLPPYSTVIGMFHKILEAKSGEYFPMNISIQGDYESAFTNYQNLRMFKRSGEVTSMPRNVHQLLNVELIIHVEAEDEIIDKIYYNIIHGANTFTLGRNEDLVRVDGINFVNDTKIVRRKLIEDYNAYIPNWMGEDDELVGINYRLNTTYKIEKDLRKWEKIDVKYIEKHTDNGLEETLQDDEGYNMYFYKKK